MRQAVIRVRKEVMDCYEPLRRERPEARAMLTVEFQVVPLGDRGHIESAEASHGTIGDLLVEQCIMNVLTTVRFPRPSSERVKFLFPFFFGPTAAP